MNSPVNARWTKGRIGLFVGSLVLLLWACGDQNLFGPGAVAPPQVDVSLPVPGEGVPVGDSILVEARVARAPFNRRGAVTRVRFDGVAHLGDASLGTDQVIVLYPAQEVSLDPPISDARVLSRFLQSNGDTTSAPVFIRVTAIDEFGNEATDSVAVRVGAPGVRFISPVEGETVGIGSTLTVDVQATDVAGVSTLEVFRGEEGLTAPELPFAQSYSPPLDTARLSQTITVPDNTGFIELMARAVNRNGLESVIGPITVNVSTQAASDETAPQLRVRYLPAGSDTDGVRVESTDNLTFVVEGRDNTGGQGVAQVGLSLFAEPRDRDTAERLVPVATREISPARSGTFSTVIDIPVSELEALGSIDDRTLDMATAPDTVNLEFFGFMVDQAGNCAAAVSSEEFQSLECASSNGSTVAAGAQGQEGILVGVGGQTVSLPRGGVIADAVVDETRNFLVLSNISQGRLEIFDMSSSSFLPGIFAGAEPWGLTFSRTNPDSLYVGNSFGTNVSIVDMASMTEDVGRRIQTPNTVLFDVQENRTESGYEFTVTVNGFSDRPQFIAQDNQGNLVYSTVPTDAANLGTIRVATPPTATRPETEVILYTDHGELGRSEQNVAVDRLDSFGLDGVLRDHLPGTTTDVTETLDSADPSPAAAAVQRLRDAGSDARAFLGSVWDVASVGLSDTTFIAASGDGSKVAIGEGATGPTGRIIMYDAATQSVSGLIPVTDLVENSAERVVGVDLNFDGTLGVARGAEAVYYFTPDLRLQGGVTLETSGAGAALHPFHSNGPTLTDPNVALSFAGTDRRSIQVVDTRHFTLLGEVAIRENLIGQLRAVMPDNSDQPAGFPSCTDGGQEIGIGGLGSAKRLFSDAEGLSLNADLADACVVVKLTGVTADGGVVVVPVTKGEATRFHPDRE